MHNACMTVITIRNVPDDVNENLKRQARARGQSLQQFLLRELEEAAHRTPLEQRLREVLESLPRVNLTRAEILEDLEESRRERDA